jgi:outer membrane immunogenic protein
MMEGEMRQLTRSTLLVALSMNLPLFAHAADMPLPYKAPTCCDWRGYYVGLNVGAVQDLASTNDNWVWRTTYPAGSLIGRAGGPLIATTGPNTFDTYFNDHGRPARIGLIGGFQTGYNWQFGALVVGLEGDWSFGYVRNNTSYLAQPMAGVFPPLPNFFFIPETAQGWNAVEKLEWLTTLRTRIGLADGHYLWYLTGGPAVARIDTAYALSSSPGYAGNTQAAGPFGPGTGAQWGLLNGVGGASFAQTRIGWSAGAGVEVAIGELLGWGIGTRWTTRLEYLFVDLGKLQNAFTQGLVPLCASTCANPATGTTLFTSDRHIYEQIVRVGINYKL